jgi:hypothetical protein
MNVAHYLFINFTAFNDRMVMNKSELWWLVFRTRLNNVCVFLQLVPLLFDIGC